MKKDKKQDLISKLPKFKYHPNLYHNDDVKFERGVCQCCGKKVDAYVYNMYCVEDVDCICLECVASGRAAEKFDGEFVEWAENVSDAQKQEELFKRTPGYSSWQGEHWLACCDDYCAYLGSVGLAELNQMGIAEQVLADYRANEEYQFTDEQFEDLCNALKKGVSVCGYLFQCLHCGKYRLWIDMD